MRIDRNLAGPNPHRGRFDTRAPEERGNFALENIGNRPTAGEPRSGTRQLRVRNPDRPTCDGENAAKGVRGTVKFEVNRNRARLHGNDNIRDRFVSVSKFIEIRIDLSLTQNDLAVRAKRV